MGPSEAVRERAIEGRNRAVATDWRETVAENWSAALPRGSVAWGRRVRGLNDLLIVPNDAGVPELMETSLLAGRVGLVVSPPPTLEAYVQTYGRGNVALPETYAAFPEGDAPLAGRTVDGRCYELPAARVEAALRELNGKGRFDAEEFRLVDCSPGPAVMGRAGGGAVLVAPRTRSVRP